MRTYRTPTTAMQQTQIAAVFRQKTVAVQSTMPSSWKIVLDRDELLIINDDSTSTSPSSTSEARCAFFRVIACTNREGVLT